MILIWSNGLFDYKVYQIDQYFHQHPLVCYIEIGKYENRSIWIMKVLSLYQYHSLERSNQEYWIHTIKLNCFQWMKNRRGQEFFEAVNDVISNMILYIIIIWKNRSILERSISSKDGILWSKSKSFNNDNEEDGNWIASLVIRTKNINIQFKYSCLRLINEYLEISQ